MKLIKDPHVADQYTALLAVERAHSFDEGKFTCQVEDFKLQQCISRDVKISKRPSIKTEPISLTVRRVSLYLEFCGCDVILNSDDIINFLHGCCFA